MRVTSLVALLLFLTLVLAGCASPPSVASSGEQAWSSEQLKSQATTLKSQGYSEQAAALEDGKVTASEYMSSIENLRACIERKGYLVSNPQLSPLTNTTYEFVYEVNGRDQKKALVDYGACETRYWLPISAAYADTAPQKMDQPLREAIVSCMSARGVSVSSGASTLKEIAGDNLEKNVTRRSVAGECAQSETVRLYPDLRTVTLSF